MRKYENFVSNLRVLETADKEVLDNEFIVGGIIDKFFVQFELGWKLLKELLAYEGRSDFASESPRSIIKTAFEVWGFIDEEVWLAMLADRNNLSHVYDKSAARRLVNAVLKAYVPEFQKVEANVNDKYGSLLHGNE